MIYLDYQATTPLAPEAREEMLRWLGGPDGDAFGNPHSPHRLGRKSAAAVEVARERVAALFPAGGRVIFTGSACEAINLAIRGTVGTGRVAVSAIEHAAVIDTAHVLGNPHIIPVDQNGQAVADGAMPDDVSVLGIMQINNEIGTIQPVDALAQQAKAVGAKVLCDAVQGAGKLAPPEHADMIAISGHKIYGPKGIGALWVRDGLDLEPQITGGLQEGWRSGTLNPALCAGFGVAAQLSAERMEEDKAHTETLWARARDLFSDWTLNGSEENRWHGNLSIRREGLDVAQLMSACRNVMFSAGSACASGSGKPSHVLKAIGLSDEEAKSSIRLGWGRYTTMDEIEAAAEEIKAAVAEQAAWA